MGALTMSEQNGQSTSDPSRLLSIFSAITSRSELSARLGTTFGGLRNVHETLGYKVSLTFRDYKARVLRQHIAHRLIEVFPKATWAAMPKIEADDSPEQETPFEQGWESLVKRLRLLEVFERVDRLQSLGEFAVLLIGLKNQGNLALPASLVRQPEDILYCTPYSQEWATIQQLVTATDSPDFGRPLTYTINLGRSTVAARAASATVHASRVIHIAEDLLDDEVYAIPRLMPIYDLLDDLLKVIGGSAEMFWQDAKRRIVFSLRDDWKLQPEDEKALSDEIDEFMHQLKSFIRVQGMDVQTLTGQTQSPRDHVDVFLDMISATLGVPKRILLGSEVGDLASTQDKTTWAEQVANRQRRFAEPQILRAVIDRCLTLGALPDPGQPYQVTWPALLSLSEAERSVVAQAWASAITQYTGAGFAASLVPHEEFRERYLQLPSVPRQPTTVVPATGEI